MWGLSHGCHDALTFLLHLMIKYHTGFVWQCKNKGLKVAVASSADRIKVDANLAAAGLPLSM